MKRLFSRNRVLLATLFIAFAISGAFIFPLQVSVPAHAQEQPAPVSQNIPVIAPGSAYRQTNLLSDIPGAAPVLDPLLVNPWGITATSSSPFWVANNGTSTTQLIRGDVGGAPVVLNPSPQTVNIPGGLPTGAERNSTSDFKITPP